MSAPRTIQKWHHDAAKAIFDEHVLPGFHAAHIEIEPEDRVKMIAALAAKIAAHEPPQKALEEGSIEWLLNEHRKIGEAWFANWQKEQSERLAKVLASKSTPKPGGPWRPIAEARKATFTDAIPDWPVYLLAEAGTFGVHKVWNYEVGYWDPHDLHWTTGADTGFGDTEVLEPVYFQEIETPPDMSGAGVSIKSRL